jgi:hypothetical protein
MPITLYDALVPSWLQLLDSLLRLIDKAEAHCADKGLAPASLIEARLAPDMHPFAYQVKSCAVHSLGAIEGVRRGEFSPDSAALPDSFAALRERIETARAGIAALDPAEVESFIGRDMAFVFSNVFRREYLADQFLLSFSQPNFYFHATAAYAILRAEGVAIGKRDYLGATRVR